MAEIALLSQETIDKIAAGEVIERPSSVVKELTENAIDAGATAITIEIKDGGLSLIRITDNGCGIEKSQVPLAFLRHSTSKITSVEDLLTVSSLGFRGEALSSIAAVAQVELITKTMTEFTGTRYVIEGSVEKEREDIGAPDGTTFVVRNLFYNIPARRKFLKAAQTEAGYIHTMAERLALSRPDISFQLISNNQTKLHTSGNSNAKDVIYQIYGREITSSLIELSEENELFSVSGFLGKPTVSRGNRNFENYFINQRFIKSSLLAKALEDAYKSFLMQRQYPFCVLYFTFQGEMLDVNVHPAKMELRFLKNDGIYQALYGCIRAKLSQKDHVRPIALDEGGKADGKKTAPLAKGTFPEPFEKNRRKKIASMLKDDSPYEAKYPNRLEARDGCLQQTPAAGQSGAARQAPLERQGTVTEDAVIQPQEAIGRQGTVTEDAVIQPQESRQAPVIGQEAAERQAKSAEGALPVQESFVQEELTYEGKFLSEQARRRHKMIGQLFDTYWLVEYDGKLFIIDQHAAHEKVLYERTVKLLKTKEMTTQLVSPPLILSLDAREEAALSLLERHLTTLGYEIEPFGGKEYAVCGVPGNLFGLDAKQALYELLDAADEITKPKEPELILEKIASMSCKAAVKGNHALSRPEAEALIGELLALENPYFCPHGRPTILSMDKYEIEKKFKRIV